jgi:hypothetical protein
MFGFFKGCFVPMFIFSSKKNIFCRTVFIILTILFVFHSSPVFSEADMPDSPRDDGVLDEELR